MTDCEGRRSEADGVGGQWRGKNMKHLRLASWAALTTATPCYAQTATPSEEQLSPASPTAPQAEETASEEIIVTAQKRSQRINDIGLSIQAFTGDDLKDAGVTTTSDLSQVVTGFNFARSSANTPIYTLRGIGFQTPNLSSTSPVGIYVDEVAYAYPYMANGPTFDLERVEVLKGPQGTLYGRNTTGGLVNFITARPTKSLQAGMTAEVGSYETYNFEGFVSGPLTDTLSIRVAARSENSDKGWQKSVSRSERLGKKDRTGARIALDWRPTDKVNVLVGASWWQDKSDTVAPQAVGLDIARPATVIPGLQSTIRDHYKNDEADWDPAEAGKPGFRTDSSLYSLTARINYELSDAISLVSLSGYNHVRRRDFNDLDGTPFELLAYGSNGRIGAFSQELRVVGEAEGLNYLLGVFYAKDDVSDDQLGYYGQNSTVRFLRVLGARVAQTTYTQEQIAGGFRNFLNSTDQENESASVLGNLEWEFADRWTLIAGARYTKDKIAFAGCSRDYQGNTAPVWNTGVALATRSNTNVQPGECLTYNASFTDNVLAEDTLREDNLAGRFGINYEPDDNTLIYASVARGYKSDAFPVLPANVETQFFPAVQEEVLAFETGLKAGLFNRVLQLNLSAFYYKYKNKQIYGDVRDVVFTTLPRIVNVPESRVVGAEAEFIIRATDSLRLQGGASYVNTKVTEFIGINRLGREADFAGLEFPNTPELQINGQVNFERPISNRLAFTATASANYQSEAEGAIGNEPEFRIKAYTLVNGSLGVRTMDDRISFSLFARNLLNQNYWTNVDTIIDTIFRVPGMPRTFGARLSYRY